MIFFNKCINILKIQAKLTKSFDNRMHIFKKKLVHFYADETDYDSVAVKP